MVVLQRRSQATQSSWYQLRLAEVAGFWCDQTWGLFHWAIISFGVALERSLELRHRYRLQSDDVGTFGLNTERTGIVGGMDNCSNGTAADSNREKGLWPAWADYPLIVVAVDASVGHWSPSQHECHAVDSCMDSR